MTSALIAGFSDGITLVKADILGMIIIVIPIALVIFGIMWAIKSAKRAYKDMTDTRDNYGG